MGKLGENIPKIVYHYTSLNIGIENILKDRTLKFSRAIDFNDPFDFDGRLIEVEIDASIENMKLYNEANQYEKNIYRGIIKSKNTELKKLFQETHEQFKEVYWASCFSKRKDNVLLWSHSGDKHKGLSIGFSTEGYEKYFKELDYPKEIIPKKIIIGTTERFLEKVKRENSELKEIFEKLSEKAIEWECEEEIRFFIQQLRKLNYGIIIQR